ncbi:MAG: pyridoxal 5'-phosphate synthase glutaminase subunit PdxT [Lachnospiraceae bacterium]|nr:pyridoxal 5'-phosphate synthase glutaminase subunit PdxT [Lachnospiraceae bacterium]
MRIAVRAVQGAFIEHDKKLESLGVSCLELRKRTDLDNEFSGLILPGGESTVQGKLLRDLGMMNPLRERIQNGLPVLATCAGLILLAEHLSNDENVWFGTLPVTVRRNAYGRQLGSFHTEAEFAGIGRVPMTFIRAPYIETVAPDVEILATVKKADSETPSFLHSGDANPTLEQSTAAPHTASLSQVIAVRSGRQIGLAFHPELNSDNRIHERFLRDCRASG